MKYVITYRVEALYSLNLNFINIYKKYFKKITRELNIFMPYIGEDDTVELLHYL